MRRRVLCLTFPLLLISLIAGYARIQASGARLEWLWSDPTDIESRNLIYGSGSEERAPHAAEYTFIEEDLGGFNPKYLVEDADGVKWKIKLGPEVGPEIAASRLLWAVGYHTHEDYYVRCLRVMNLPEKLHRGKELIGPGGMMRAVRMRRQHPHEKKVATWDWEESPFLETREFNGLRTMMALLNNWDLKGVNNAIYDNSDPTPERPERFYMVSDLGSSFGSTELLWGQSRIKGNLEYYRRSKFIKSITPELVSFSVPGHFPIDNLTLVVHYLYRRPRRWITREIPRADAKWLGELLSRLSPAQLRDAFLAAGYGPGEAAGFATVVQDRIALLRAL